MGPRSESDVFCFLRAAARSPLHVGAVAPSSRAVARQMLAGLDFQPDSAVLELGPGTGAFTHVLIERLPDRAAYLGIERDSHLVQILRNRFPGLEFVHGSAEDAIQYLEGRGYGRVQAIISGLPFASLPDPVQDRIFATLQVLMQPGVVFRAIQYFHAQALPSAVRFRRRMSSLFGPVEVSRPVLWNLPPAVVLSWVGAATERPREPSDASPC